MTQMEQLPEVELYAIGAAEADYAAPLLTDEAVEAIKNDEAFGMALVEENETRAAICARLSPENEAVLELLSFYVAPSARRRGLGGTLLLELIEHVMAETEGSMTAVTATFAEAQEELRSLFEKAGFRVEPAEQMAEWYVSLAELSDSSLLQQHGRLPKDCLLTTLEQMSDIGIRRLVEKLQEHAIDDLNASKMRMALQRESYVMLDGRQEPKACVVISAADETHLWLSQFFAERGGVTYGLSALQAAARALLERYPKDTWDDVVIEIPTLNDASAGLVQKLLAPKMVVQMMNAVLELGTVEVPDETDTGSDETE